jgi:hypothetical protein
VSASLETLLSAAPYGPTQAEKRALLLERARELSLHHYERCEPYQ